MLKKQQKLKELKEVEEVKEVKEVKEVEEVEEQQQNNVNVVLLQQPDDIEIEKIAVLEIEDNNSNENIDIVDTLEMQQPVSSEPPVVIPKKTKRKNKH
jgi:hypothetical protein